MVSVLSSAVEVCWGSPWSWGFKTCGHLDRVVEWGWQWRWLFGSGRNRQDLSLFLFVFVVFVVFVCICICCHSVFLYVILGVVSGKLSDGLAVGGVWVNLRGWAGGPPRRSLHIFVFVVTLSEGRISWLYFLLGVHVCAFLVFVLVNM